MVKKTSVTAGVRIVDVSENAEKQLNSALKEMTDTFIVSVNVDFNQHLAVILFKDIEELPKR